MVSCIRARLGTTLLLAAALAAALTSVAHADEADTLLDEAQHAIDDTIDYEAARGLTDRALATGGLDAAGLARAYHLAGEIAAALGDVDAARGHYLRWILIEPSAALSADVSPKLAEPFAAARAEAARIGGFTVEPRLERVAGELRVSLDASDPLQLIAGFHVSLDSGAAGDGRSAGAVVELAVDDAAPVTVSLRIVDARGNELATRDAVAEPRTTAAPPRATSNRWPTLVRWPTWTVLAGVSAGVGGYFAWQLGKDEDELAAINAEPELHTFEEARAVVDRGDRDALGANLGFAVAGVAAVAAILTFVLEPGDTELAPLAASDGAGASALLRF